MDLITDLTTQFGTYYEKIIALIPKLGVAIIVVTLFLFIMRFIRTRLNKIIENKAEDQLLIDFFDRIFRIFNIIVGILLFLYIVGLAGIAGSALGGLGIGAIIVGFAFKDIAENFLAGVIMAFKRPFRVGDTIESQSIVGSVIGMNLRETHLKSFDGKDVYIPNGQILKNPLFNFTIDGFMRNEFNVSIAFDSDIAFVRNLILDTMKQVNGVVNEGKEPSTLISELSNSAIVIKVQYWINTFDKSISSGEVRSISINNVLEVLAKENVKIQNNVIEIRNTSTKKEELTDESL